jgi:hypothetical protein
LGAEKVLPTRLSRILIFILFNNLGNLLLVQSEPEWAEHGRSGHGLGTASTLLFEKPEHGLPDMDFLSIMT